MSFSPLYLKDSIWKHKYYPNTYIKVFCSINHNNYLDSFLRHTIHDSKIVIFQNAGQLTYLTEKEFNESYEHMMSFHDSDELARKHC